MKRSQLLLYTNLFTLLYLGFGYYVFIALGMGSQQGDTGWGVLIFAVLSIFLVPHLILFSVGLILVGWRLRKIARVLPWLPPLCTR